MPTEKQIREAIASVISTAAPNAIVLPRNILDITDSSWLGAMHSAADSHRIHGWMVSQQAARIRERRQVGVEYALEFRVWQFYEYRTGDNSSNSEDVASAEREAVMLAFAAPSTLSPTLSWVEPLEFQLIDLFDRQDGRGLVWIAQGSITVANVTGC